MASRLATFDNLSAELKLLILEEIYKTDPEQLAVFRLMSHQLHDLVTPIRYRLFKLKKHSQYDPIQAKVISDGRKHLKHAVISDMTWLNITSILPKFPGIETMHIGCNENQPLKWESRDGVAVLPAVAELSIHVLPEGNNRLLFKAPWNFTALVRLELHAIAFYRLFGHIHGTLDFPMLRTFKTVDIDCADYGNLTPILTHVNIVIIGGALLKMPIIEELDFIGNISYFKSCRMPVSELAPARASLKTLRIRSKERGGPHDSLEAENLTGYLETFQGLEELEFDLNFQKFRVLVSEIGREDLEAVIVKLGKLK